MIRRYGLLGVSYLIYCKIRSLFVSPHVRLIRFPIDLRNRHLISFGKGFTTGVGCRIEVESSVGADTGGKKLSFGENVQINDYVHITAAKSVIIGNNVLIASKVYISDCSHGSYSGDLNDSSPISSPNARPLFLKPVILEDNVWIGEFVSILPGVTIGKGTIVGANSVVTKSLPANIIAVGSPAKAIKKFNFETERWEPIIF